MIDIILERERTKEKKNLYIVLSECMKKNYNLSKTIYSRGFTKSVKESKQLTLTTCN